MNAAEFKAIEDDADKVHRLLSEWADMTEELARALYYLLEKSRARYPGCPSMVDAERALAHYRRQGWYYPVRLAPPH